MVLGVAASLIARLLTSCVALLSVPLTISYLGAERYGLWLTVSSVIAMMSFADLGIGNGLLTEVSRAQGEQEDGRIRSLSSSAFFSLSAIALVLGGLGAWLIPTLDWASLFGTTSPAARAEALPVTVTLAVLFILGVPASVAERVQMGTQATYIATAWNAAGSLVSLLGLLVVTQLELGLVALVVCLSGAPTFARVVNSLWFFYGPGKAYRPSLSSMSVPDAQRLVRTGTLFVILQVSASFAFLSDNLVLANTIGAAGVPELAIPTQMFSFLIMPVAMMATTMWPAYGEAAARGDTEWVRNALRRAIRVTLLFACGGGSILVLGGDTLICLWTRGQVETGLDVLIPVALSTVLMAWGTSVAGYLNGTGKLRAQTLCAVIMAPTAFGLKWILAERWGVAGIPWATVIAYFLLTFVPLSLVLRIPITSSRS
jgi:O-antigen/teichoic acid export membrane protein